MRAALRSAKLNARSIGAAAAALSILFVSSCGLPSYSSLDAPSVISYGSTNKVGFNPADDVDGYIIYYKIYEYGSSSIDSDEDKFDPSNYDDDNIPNGTTVPENQDFTEMRWANVNSSTTPLIEYDGDDSVVFDFTSSINLGDSGVSDPVLYINDNDMSSSMGIPGRGVKGSDGNYKRFVLDYELTDSDMDSSVNTNESIIIAFAAISYGLDPSSLDSSMSVPVYLGTVYQQNFKETED